MLAITSCVAQHDNYEDLLHDLYKNSVPIITPAQLNQELAINNKMMIIDAREKEEYEVSHLKGSQFAGYNDFDSKKYADTPKDTKIVVYCSVGYRSERVGEKLIKAGFTNVFNLYGGIFEWKNEGLPVYVNKEETDRVHAYSKKWGKWLKKGTKVYE